VAGINRPLSFARTGCVLCDHPVLTDEITLPEFPVYMGMRDTSGSEQDRRATLGFATCARCGLGQLSTLIDPEVLYQRFHNPSLGRTWTIHHDKFAEYISQWVPASSRLLEIGGSNKALYNRLASLEKYASYVIMDQHHSGEQGQDEQRLPCEEETFLTLDSNLSSLGPFDSAISSHTFEHFYEPIAILKKFRRHMTEGQLMIMSVPDISAQLNKGHTNAMNFEHTFLVDARVVEKMAQLSGWEMLDVTHFHEFNFFVVLRAGTTTTTTIDRVFNYSKDIFARWRKELKDFVVSANEKIFQHTGPTYVFGAHIFTQMLMAFGLDTASCEAVLDNDPQKIGRFLYGTDLPVVSPRELLPGLESGQPSLVILHAGPYNREIRDGLMALLPGVEIHGGE
jgi:hypothetical protein